MMSGTWDQHIATVNGYLADQKAKRAAKAAAAAAAIPQTPITPPTPDPGVSPDQWQGGDNMANFGPAPAAGDMGNLIGGMGLSGNAIGGLIGGLGGGLLGGPLGGLAGALAGRGIGGMLSAPGPQAQPTAPGIGSLGGEAFGGNAAGPGAFGGGLGDAMAAGMGLGVGGLGAMSGSEILGFDGFQKGGYTGAGRDGRVQPDRVAGVVHEGELVIPHHMVRRMGLLRR
jgi:hypothetical protein